MPPVPSKRKRATTMTASNRRAKRLKYGSRPVPRPRGLSLQSSFKRAKRRYYGRATRRRERGGKTYGFAKKVTRVINSTKPLGTYKKVLPTWQYHITGDSVDNRQGIHEFYSLRPIEVLDAASVLFNSKTAAADYTVPTTNFTGDYDLTISSWYDTYYATNTSQFPLEFVIYTGSPKQDSETSFKVRWQSSINDVVLGLANSIKPEMMHLSPSFGSHELNRYWAISRGKRMTIQPGQKRFIKSFKTSNYIFKQENMEYGGTIIAYRRGLTKLLMIKQLPRIEYEASGPNFIGAPLEHLGGWVMERVTTANIVAPDVASEAQHVDKVMYLQNYNSAITTAAVFPSKASVANIPVPAQ